MTALAHLSHIACDFQQDIESAIELLKLYSISQERNASDALRAAEAARDAAEKDAADLREKLKALANDLAAAEADHDRKQHDLQAEIEALKAELEAVKNRDKERNDSDARSNAMLQEALDVANERLKNAKVCPPLCRTLGSVLLTRPSSGRHCG